jgi:hypothetical protein
LLWRLVARLFVLLFFWQRLLWRVLPAHPAALVGRCLLISRVFGCVCLGCACCCVGGPLGTPRPQTLPVIRQVFDSFLQRFPLCYGYWNQVVSCYKASTVCEIRGRDGVGVVYQYAQNELSKAADGAEGFANAQAVYERAAAAVANSVVSVL